MRIYYGLGSFCHYQGCAFSFGVVAAMSGWRRPIRIAGGVPVIAVIGDGEVWHDTEPRTPEEAEWLEDVEVGTAHEQ